MCMMTFSLVYHSCHIPALSTLTWSFYPRPIVAIRISYHLESIGGEGRFHPTIPTLIQSLELAMNIFAFEK